MPLLSLHNFFPGYKPLLPCKLPSARARNNCTNKQTETCLFVELSAMSGNAVSQNAHRGYWRALGGCKECFWVPNTYQVHSLDNNSVIDIFSISQLWKLRLRRVSNVGCLFKWHQCATENCKNLHSFSVQGKVPTSRVRTTSCHYGDTLLLFLTSPDFLTLFLLDSSVQGSCVC